jgi:alpha-mannosidase
MLVFKKRPRQLMSPFSRNLMLNRRIIWMMARRALPMACGAVLVPAVLAGQTMKAPDIMTTPTLYVVPYAHLDTQWRWEFPQTISEFLLKTMRVNFEYIDRYPHYVFNWSGANRYRLMKEYYPADYARMKRYVAEGRWFPAGSSVEEGDVNLPSAEGLFRQFLYGNYYFRTEFGKASEEYMLPDCFGFPASLPTLLAHAGIKGFSTQKLNAGWQPAPLVGGPSSPEQTPEGIPYNVGRWKGPDGTVIIAALNPGNYEGTVFSDLSQPPVSTPRAILTDQQKATLSPREQRALTNPPVEQDWGKRIALDGKVTGVFADYHYVGTGDVGGATTESTVALLEATVDHTRAELSPALRDGLPVSTPGPNDVLGRGPVRVIIASADQMFNDLKPDMTTRMPEYTGDLELINHSAGSLTSEAQHKRWVIKNENLADAAEKASLGAMWVGAAPYPQKRLDQAWMLALGGHFHDTAAGTATPRAYQFAWNDDAITANQFAAVLTDSSTSIASVLDTSGAGVPVVIFNPLSIAREDVVQAALPGGTVSGSQIRITGPDGVAVPAQVSNGKVLFLAKVPSAGYVVYHIAQDQKEHAKSDSARSPLHVTATTLENARYKVSVNPQGDVSSIFDKQLGRELLAAPMRMAFSTDRPSIYPAWNMDFEQEQAAPRAYLAGPAQIHIVEDGPVRVALEVTRSGEGTRVVQRIRLSAGDAGNRVEFANAIDWKSLAANLKATFPLAASNTDATYSWDVGTVQRPNAFDRQFEVASHRWIDLTDRSGSFGTTILTDVKNGSDKRDDNILRLTLLRSPGIQPETNGRHASYTDQANQDWGHHDDLYGLVGHAGDWRDGGTEWQAYRLNDPLIAFTTTSHSGRLGKSFSMVQVNDPHVRILALKKAQASDEVILRMVEMTGKPAAHVAVSFASPVINIREVSAQELPLEITPAAPAQLVNGVLETSFTAYQPRTFALTLAPAQTRAAEVISAPVALRYDLAVASNDDTPTAGGGFDGKGNALPAEMLPAQVDFDAVRFNLAPAGTGLRNAVTAHGQAIALPGGTYNRVYILAASSAGDHEVTFKVGNQAKQLYIQAWNGFIGQADTRLWTTPLELRDWAVSAGHAVWPPVDQDARESYSPPRFPQDYLGLTPGYVKPAPVAWYASHHHTSAGLNEPYQYSYLFAYPIDLPAGATTLTLPDDSSIRILAISVAQTGPTLTPAQPLYDTFNRTEPEPAKP